MQSAFPGLTPFYLSLLSRLDTMSIQDAGDINAGMRLLLLLQAICTNSSIANDTKLKMIPRKCYHPQAYKKSENGVGKSTYFPLISLPPHHLTSLTSLLTCSATSRTVSPILKRTKEQSRARKAAYKYLCLCLVNNL